MLRSQAPVVKISHVCCTFRVCTCVCVRGREGLTDQSYDVYDNDEEKILCPLLICKQLSGAESSKHANMHLAHSSCLASPVESLNKADLVQRFPDEARPVGILMHK